MGWPECAPGVQDGAHRRVARTHWEGEWCAEMEGTGRELRVLGLQPSLWSSPRAAKNPSEILTCSSFVIWDSLKQPLLYIKTPFFFFLTVFFAG